MKICQHFNHTRSPAVHGNVPAFSLHKCAGSAQKCASIIHKRAGSSQKRASIIHKFSAFAQKCASNVHKCSNSAQKCASKPKVLNNHRFIVSQQETRGFGDLHPSQHAWRKSLNGMAQAPYPTQALPPTFFQADFALLRLLLWCCCPWLFTLSSVSF